MNPIKTSTQAIFAGLLAIAIILIASLSFGSCSSIKPIEPTELETEATFNYSQTFQAKLVANGVGEVPLYKECNRTTSNVKIGFTGNENYQITDDGGDGSISWSNENSIVYTVNGKVTEITFLYGEDDWVKYW
jgi:hypothetical protein